MITVFGDSHTSIFTAINEAAQFDIFKVVSVPGATALGAVRPDSATNALNEFRKVLMSDSTVISKVIIHLGEVDCGFLSWLLAKKKGGLPFEYLQRSVESVATFATEVLDSCRQLEPSDIMFLGVPYSIEVDTQSRHFLHGLRAEVVVTKTQVDEGIDFYNRCLQNVCLVSGYTYIDSASIYCSPLKQVCSMCLPDSPFDHHLNYNRAWALLICALLGEQIDFIQETRDQRFHYQSNQLQKPKSFSLAGRVKRAIKRLAKTCLRKRNAFFK